MGLNPEEPSEVSSSVKVTKVYQPSVGLNPEEPTEVISSEKVTEVYDPSLHASIKEKLFSKQSLILYLIAVLSIFCGYFV